MFSYLQANPCSRFAVQLMVLWVWKDTWSTNPHRKVPKEPSADANRWWFHVNQQISRVMLITSSSRSGSDGSQASSPLGVECCLHSQRLRSGSHCAGSRSSTEGILWPSIPHCLHLRYCCRVLLLSWAEKLSQPESWIEFKYSRKWLRAMSVTSCAWTCVCFPSFALRTIFNHSCTLLQPSSLNKPLLFCSFCSSLLIALPCSSLLIALSCLGPALHGLLPHPCIHGYPHHTPCLWDLLAWRPGRGIPSKSSAVHAMISTSPSSRSSHLIQLPSAH